MTSDKESKKRISSDKKKALTLSDILIPIGVVIGILIIWQVVCDLEIVPSYMLPSPKKIANAFVSDFPLLMQHSKVTLIEALLGMVIGVLLGFITAALMDTFQVVKKGLYPILVITQTIPPVAIAPVLILWFSYGITPKVVLVVLVVYFPIAVGLLEGDLKKLIISLVTVFILQTIDGNVHLGMARRNGGPRSLHDES